MPPGPGRQDSLDGPQVFCRSPEGRPAVKQAPSQHLQAGTRRCFGAPSRPGSRPRGRELHTVPAADLGNAKAAGAGLGEGPLCHPPGLRGQLPLPCGQDRPVPRPHPREGGRAAGGGTFQGTWTLKRGKNPVASEQGCWVPVPPAPGWPRESPPSAGTVIVPWWQG